MMMDLSLRLHWAVPKRHLSPLLVLGAQGDRICTADDVRATAKHHDVEATIIPGLAHMMMLEPEWKRPAVAIAAFIENL